MNAGNVKGVARVLVALMASGTAGCASSPNQTEDRLQRALTTAVEKQDNGTRNAVLRVDAPALGIDGAWAAGVADHAGAPFLVDTPFLSASVGKLFTAAAVLVLADEGALKLEDPVTRFVPWALLAGLPVTGGDDALRAVTIRQLLTHRSGLPDYFSNSKSQDGAPKVLDLLVAEPQRAWTTKDLLDYTREHFAAAGAPGEHFLYADTNYDLLGLVLEGVTGQPFHTVVESRIIAPLGLTHTWYYNLTEIPADTPAHADVWIGNVNVAHKPCLTADGAGGGLATTTGDLRLFFRALLAGRPVLLSAFAEDWTRDAMHGGIDYGRGLWRIRPGGVFFLLGNLPELMGISGATGSFVYYIAKHDAVIAGSFNQTNWGEQHIQFLLSEVVPALENTLQP